MLTKGVGSPREEARSFIFMCICLFYFFAYTFLDLIIDRMVDLYTRTPSWWTWVHGERPVQQAPCFLLSSLRFVSFVHFFGSKAHGELMEKE